MVSIKPGTRQVASGLPQRLATEQTEVIRSAAASGLSLAMLVAAGILAVSAYVVWRCHPDDRSGIVQVQVRPRSKRELRLRIAILERELNKALASQTPDVSVLIRAAVAPSEAEVSSPPVLLASSNKPRAASAPGSKGRTKKASATPSAADAPTHTRASRLTGEPATSKTQTAARKTTSSPRPAATPTKRTASARKRESAVEAT